MQSRHPPVCHARSRSLHTTPNYLRENKSRSFLIPSFKKCFFKIYLSKRVLGSCTPASRKQPASRKRDFSLINEPVSRKRRHANNSVHGIVWPTLMLVGMLASALLALRMAHNGRPDAPRLSSGVARKHSCTALRTHSFRSVSQGAPSNQCVRVETGSIHCMPV